MLNIFKTKNIDSNDISYFFEFLANISNGKAERTSAQKKAVEKITKDLPDIKNNLETFTQPLYKDVLEPVTNIIAKHKDLFTGAAAGPGGGPSDPAAGGKTNSTSKHPPGNNNNNGPGDDSESRRSRTVWMLIAGGAVTCVLYCALAVGIYAYIEFGGDEADHMEVVEEHGDEYYDAEEEGGDWNNWNAGG